jgi:signal peptidase I
MVESVAQVSGARLDPDMNDDQSMRDSAAGPHGSGDQAEGSPQPGGTSTNPRGALADEARAVPAPNGPANARADDADPEQADPDETDLDEAGQSPADGDQDWSAQPGGEDGGEKRRRSLWRELPVLIVVALVIALLIKTFVVQAFFIPSSSMEDTLLIGDKVLVNKIVYHTRPIHVGDIIVFDGAGSWDPVPPRARPDSDPVARLYRATLVPLFRSIKGLFGTAPGQTDYIKRVLGVPGDRVACCNTQGQVTVNGVALHEKSYLFPGAAPSQIRFSIVVPPGRLWVMGDNRLVSDDSRLHTADPGQGTIPEKMVIGRAFILVWPANRWRVLQIPATFEQPRVGKPAAASAGALAPAIGAGAPYLPLAGGLAVALPLTRLRGRVRRRRRRRVPRTR